MHIIYDKNNKEYGLLIERSFKDVFKNVSERLVEIQPELGPEHVFYNHGKDLEVPSEEQLNKLPDTDIPMIEFYNEDNEVYDTAMYTSKQAEESYEIIKEINDINEFFKFKEKKNGRSQ